MPTTRPRLRGVPPLTVGTLGHQTIRSSKQGTPSAAKRESPPFPLPYEVLPDHTKCCRTGRRGDASPRSQSPRAVRAGLCRVTVGPKRADGTSGAVGTTSSEPEQLFWLSPLVNPLRALAKRPLPLEAPYKGLGVLKELAHGGAKGGHRLTVGVGNPLFGGSAEGILRQGVDPL